MKTSAWVEEMPPTYMAHGDWRKNQTSPAVRDRMRHQMPKLSEIMGGSRIGHPDSRPRLREWHPHPWVHKWEQRRAERTTSTNRGGICLTRRCRQAVRHGTLTPVCAGSIPATSAKCELNSTYEVVVNGESEKPAKY